MSRVLLALALNLLACTEHGADTAPPAPAPHAAASPPPFVATSSLPVTNQPQRPAAPVTLNLPATDPIVVPPYVVGQETPPTTHRLPDGREFIHDSYRDRIAVRDPATGEQTDLGEAILVIVPHLGTLIVPKNKDGAYRYHDIDPTAPRLRFVWQSPIDAYHQLAGLDRGAPLFLLRRDGVATVDLVRVPAPGAPEIRTTTLPDDFHPASTDAVRGTRLLLVGPSAKPAEPGPIHDGREIWSPFTGSVLLLDLATDQRRNLGEATGEWSMTTAVPHSYIAVRWTDHDPHGRGRWFPETCINRVDVASEHLTRCPHLP